MVITKTFFADAPRRARSSGVVIDDCRFDDEARVIHELGGIVIDVRRPGTTRINHASEAGVSDKLIDGVYDNAGDSVAAVMVDVARLVRA
jgi:hypothetical protein